MAINLIVLAGIIVVIIFVIFLIWHKFFKK